MKIVIAPDSFKESLSALQVANAIEAGFKEIYPCAEYVKCPVADGGEGTLNAMVDATGGRIVQQPVISPTGETVMAALGLSEDGRDAYIEMATASGLELVAADRRNPLTATSYGTGELIKAALDSGARRFIIGIGGSATNDAGVGMLQALGFRFLDKQGDDLPFGGGALAALATIETAHADPRLAECRFQVACDVTNPLTGETGASAIFGPQKGATPQMVQLLDANLRHFAAVVKKTLLRDIESIPGAGAAGGMGAGLLAFLNAELAPGFPLIAGALGLEALMKDANLVITGEGRIDSQTINGKVPVGVATLAKKQHLPTIAIAGVLGNGYELVYRCGIDAAFSVVSSITTLDEALTRAEDNIRRCARDTAALLALAPNLYADAPMRLSQRAAGQLTI